MVDERLTHLLGIMREECAKIGRNPAEIEITAMAYGLDLDAVRRSADLGVHRLVTIPPGFDPESVERGLGELRDRVIRAM